VKIYKIGGLTFQYREGHQPEDAQEVEPPEMEAKPKQARARQATPRNKKTPR